MENNNISLRKGPWDKSEVEILKKNYKKVKTYAELAKILNRSTNSVYAKCMSLELHVKKFILNSDRKYVRKYNFIRSHRLLNSHKSILKILKISEKEYNTIEANIRNNYYKRSKFKKD